MRASRRTITGVVCAAVLLSGCEAGPPEPEPTSSPLTVVTGTSPAPPTWAETVGLVSPGVVGLEPAGCDTEEGVVGSGFQVGDSLVLTAAHVVQRFSRWTVSTPTGTVQAYVLGVDPATDLALLRTDYPLSGHTFTFATEVPGLATEVAVLGYPLGGGVSSTRGSVSGRLDEVTLDGEDLALLQTDAAVNPGNSGGPVLTIDGAAVGVVVSKAAASPFDTPVEGTAYAVPAAVAKATVERWGALSRDDDAVLCVVDPPVVASPGGTDDVFGDEREDVVDALVRHGAALNAGHYSAALDGMTPSMRSRQRPVADWVAGLRWSTWDGLSFRSVEIDADTALAELALLTTRTDPADGSTQCLDLELRYRLVREPDDGWLLDRAETLDDPSPCDDVGDI